VPVNKYLLIAILLSLGIVFSNNLKTTTHSESLRELKLAAARLQLTIKSNPIYYSDLPESGYLHRISANCDTLIYQIEQHPRGNTQIVSIGKQLLINAKNIGRWSLYYKNNKYKGAVRQFYFNGGL